MQDHLEEVSNDGGDESVVEVVGSRYFSLLASKDRDFLLSQAGTQVKVSDLEGKVVGIYFSANWYRPCRNFNQVLTTVYDQLKDRNPGFEIVFVSSDEDLDAFNDYRASMPWLAIPFSDLETKKALTQMFDIEDLPCLVILQPGNDKNAAAIRNGVKLINRYGVQAFPFTVERLEELQEQERNMHENQTLLDLLSTHDRDFLLSHPFPKQVPIASLIGKTVGLYFSAHWCVPGVEFTEKLISIYQNIKQELVLKSDEDFEIVYLSSDHDKIAFDAHFQTMPWLASPFRDATVARLIKYFDIHWIPSLIVLRPDGKTVTKNGRNLINLYRENAYPFTEDRVRLLEKQMDEEAKSFPETEHHLGHHHELKLVSEGTGGGPFICCACDEQGSGWAYLCIECGYEVHLKCVQPVEHGPSAVK